jgi:hypothetical protein
MKFLETVYLPNEIRMQVLQKDIFGKDVLYYFEKVDAFKLMETSIIDQILREVTRGTDYVPGEFM